jgi:hypothetical protein
MRGQNEEFKKRKRHFGIQKKVFSLLLFFGLSFAFAFQRRL